MNISIHTILCSMCGRDAKVEQEDYDPESVMVLCGQCYTFMLRDRDDKQVY